MPVRFTPDRAAAAGPHAAWRAARVGRGVAWLALAALCTGAAAATTVLHNVSGYTPSKQGWQRFAALEFDDSGRVTAVHAVAPAPLPDDIRALDGGGKVVLPGLIDAHAHLLSQAQLARQVDLVGSASLAEAQSRIASFLDQHKNGDGWVLGRGWNQVLWPGKAFPTAADLDEAVRDRPAYLRRIDGHAAWANSAALALAGVDRESVDPPGGRVLRHPDGTPSGILIDAAMELVAKFVPQEATRAREEDIRNTIAALNAVGLTGVHQAGISVAAIRQLEDIYTRGALPIRLYLLLDADVDLDAFGPPRAPQYDDRLTTRAVKLYTDGALGSRGAAMLAPYSDEPDKRGLLFTTLADMTRQVQRAHAAGYQVGIHAIGDAGNRQAIDAIEAALNGSANVLRHRIEHLQVVDPADVERVAELGIVASMQPVHATSDMNMAEDRVGARRMAGAYAWRSLLDRGVVIASGSDFPVELTNPFHGIHAAVTRRNADGEPAGGWYRNEAMTRIEAVTSFTRGAAYSAHQEDRLGSLEPGKWADFIVIDRNIMTVPEQDIRDTRVLETWVGGQRIYRARSR